MKIKLKLNMQTKNTLLLNEIDKFVKTDRLENATKDLNVISFYSDQDHGSTKVTVCC